VLAAAARYAMKVVLILPVIFLFLLSACKEASRQEQVQKDTVAFVHIAVDTQSNYFKQRANQIGLVVPTVDDSFVLRLWITSMMKPDHMIELRKSGKDWITKKFIYYHEPDERLMFKEVPVELISTLNPMIASLKRIDFNHLISQEQIKGFQDNVADGITYNLEVFQSGRYKKLTYHCPEFYYSKEENNRRFVDILMLLDKHFMFYSSVCKKG
jgi:hypothetical protein